MHQPERKTYLLKVRCFTCTSVYEKASIGPQFQYHMTICVFGDNTRNKS